MKSHDTTSGGQIENRPIRFIAVKGSTIVMRGAEFIASACSRTMAKRIANALNIYRPNKKGE
jgi:hypothetical protein